MDELDIPKGITPQGRQACEIILTILEEAGMCDPHGCRVFYTPKEWEKEHDCHLDEDAVVIVVYDGGDLFEVLSYMEHHECTSKIDDKLASNGLWREHGEHFWSIIMCD